MFFGKNVYFLRKANNLSQKEFGDLFFVTNKAVSKWESELSVPDIETIKKIAEYFKTDIDTICNVDFAKQNETNTKKPKKIKKFLKYLPPACVLLTVGVAMSVILPWAFKAGNITPSPTPVPPGPLPPIPPPVETYTIDAVKLVKASSSPLKITYDVELTFADTTKTIDYIDLELLSRYSYSRTVGDQTEKGSTYVVYSKQDAQKTSLGNGKFNISHDVTNLPNNGSWFFPKLYIGDEVNDLTDTTNPFGNSIASDVSTYRVMQTDSTTNRPLVTRQAKNSDVPQGASFSFTHGEINLVNNRPQVTLSGNCTNYTYDTLSTQLGYQIKHNGGANNEYIEFNSVLNSSAVLSVDGNTFALKYYVDGLDKDSYPYYSRFKATATASFIDFNKTNCPDFSITQGQYVISGDYKYEILFGSGSGAASAYNTFGVKMTKQ